MKNLTRSYLIALSIIAVVIGLSQFLVQRSISTGSSDSRTINISGRQRMLSQKITKAALAMKVANSEEQFAAKKSELKQAYELWQASHHALQNGDAEMHMEIVNNSPEIIRLFEEVNPRFEQMSAAVNVLLADADFENRDAEQINLALDQLTGNEGAFLKLMNDITFQYDAEASERVNSLSFTEYLLFAISILLLIAEAFFIFRPVIARMKAYTMEILQKSKDLEVSLRQEEYLTHQAVSIFENVRQGVFLLDEQLMISELYSKETDRIFETKHLENTNFLKLLKSRLVKRDLDALEMFVEHLFNPDIREVVVNRLNPVSEVELFPENGSADNLEPRYIRMSFSRVYHDGKIHRILVTVLDETETVMMRKRIAETEDKIRQESAHLLAILKVAPLDLKRFLEGAMKSLSMISVVYESKKNEEFDKLLDFTFNTIHRVKGNASTIDLSIISSKLHGVEDSIMELRRTPDLEGKNFLKVVYQINDVIAILKNMQDMQDKIANIYDHQKLSELADESGTETLRSTLVKGLDTINKDFKKEVELNFEAEGVNLSSDHVRIISDLTAQLLRNSMAHGIEMPEDRVAAGKYYRATIDVKLKEQGDQIVLLYKDDGRGLDVKKILNNALKNKLIERDEIPNLTSKDIMEIIFRNDFSTTEIPDQYSGRGQGMGVIKSIVKRQNGDYKMGFKRGQYFKMEISLPKVSVSEPVM